MRWLDQECEMPDVSGKLVLLAGEGAVVSKQPWTRQSWSGRDKALIKGGEYGGLNLESAYRCGRAGLVTIHNAT